LRQLVLKGIGKVAQHLLLQPLFQHSETSYEPSRQHAIISPMIDTGLKNKVILVTGANHGIGAATARAFAAQGAKVFIQYLRLSSKTTSSKETSVPGEALYRANQAKTADEVLQLIRAQGGQVDALEIDLATPTNIPALFDRVEKAFGPVDVLVNNAAFCQADTFIPLGKRTSEDRSAGGFSLHTITAKAHDEHFAINSRATALMIARNFHQAENLCDGKKH
jgi:3-oxoacyl-[acyl-carrier protein] reductase